MGLPFPTVDWGPSLVCSGRGEVTGLGPALCSVHGIGLEPEVGTLWPGDTPAQGLPKLSSPKRLPSPEAPSGTSEISRVEATP